MHPDITLFTQTKAYYPDLIAHLETAQHKISMMYLAFDAGAWAKQIAEILQKKAAGGVSVRLMIDQIGAFTEAPRHILQNRTLLNNLRMAGVQVDTFRPGEHVLSPLNRMHCKICAIDDHTAYVGGSNIGDHYLAWSDTNLRMDGALGNIIDGVYDYIFQFGTSTAFIDPHFQLGDLRILLTIPHHQADIRSALLGLIHRADQSIHIRTWYFLPDREILQALCAKACQGVKVEVLFSHRTRIPPVDIANYLPAHQLALCGGQIHRYTNRYMHAKLAWNNQSDVLLGSANLDPHSMTRNFESCVEVRDENLAQQLEEAFNADLKGCFTQTPEIFHRRSLPQKFLTRTCSLASGWL